MVVIPVNAEEDDACLLLAGIGAGLCCAVHGGVCSKGAFKGFKPPCHG